MAYYCYIVECADGTYYTGWSTDPQRRVKVHNQGKGAKYTRMRGPVALRYVEEQPDHSSALKRERQIKTYTHDRKRKMIEENPIIK